MNSLSASKISKRIPESLKNSFGREDILFLLSLIISSLGNSVKTVGNCSNWKPLKSTCLKFLNSDNLAGTYFRLLLPNSNISSVLMLKISSGNLDMVLLLNLRFLSLLELGFLPSLSSDILFEASINSSKFGSSNKN